MSTKNLELWEKVEETPTDLIKEIDGENGVKLKSIASINRFKKATEVFGLYGDKWGLKNIVHTELVINAGLVLGNLEAVFFYTYNDKKIEFEISNSTAILIYKEKEAKVNTSYRKALETEAVTKALSKLGFNADIYTDGYLIEGGEKSESIGVDDIVQIGEAEEE